MTTTKTFYAIYSISQNKFKSPAALRGAKWLEWPSKVYDTRGRATGALKTHKSHARQWSRYGTSHNIDLDTDLVIVEISATWTI
jgi:hypothetical protein